MSTFGDPINSVARLRQIEQRAEEQQDGTPPCLLVCIYAQLDEVLQQISRTHELDKAVAVFDCMAQDDATCLQFTVDDVKTLLRKLKSQNARNRARSLVQDARRQSSRCLVVVVHAFRIERPADSAETVTIWEKVGFFFFSFWFRHDNARNRRDVMLAGEMQEQSRVLKHALRVRLVSQERAAAAAASFHSGDWKPHKRDSEDFVRTHFARVQKKPDDPSAFSCRVLRCENALLELYVQLDAVLRQLDKQLCRVTATRGAVLLSRTASSAAPKKRAKFSFYHAEPLQQLLFDVRQTALRRRDTDAAKSTRIAEEILQKYEPLTGAYRATLVLVGLFFFLFARTVNAIGLYLLCVWEDGFSFGFVVSLEKNASAVVDSFHAYTQTIWRQCHPPRCVEVVASSRATVADSKNKAEAAACIKTGDKTNDEADDKTGDQSRSHSSPMACTDADAAIGERGTWDIFGGSVTTPQ